MQPSIGIFWQAFFPQWNAQTIGTWLNVFFQLCIAAVIRCRQDWESVFSLLTFSFCCRTTEREWYLLTKVNSNSPALFSCAHLTRKSEVIESLQHSSQYLMCVSCRVADGWQVCLHVTATLNSYQCRTSTQAERKDRNINSVSLAVSHLFPVLRYFFM